MNRCAFPGCPHHIVDTNGHFIGEICHIEAANMDGERFNPNQTNEQRRHISNLLLMCPTHHTITNNVSIYDVAAMRKIKEEHERKSFGDYEISGLSSQFADAGIGTIVVLPENLDGLDISDSERDSPNFLRDARSILSAIAELPRLTRSFYAHALLRSTVHDLSIGFDPRELQTRLSIGANTVFHHASILQRARLLSDLDEEEYPAKLNYWFTTFDPEDNQIWLLQLIYMKFKSYQQNLLDIFENLNYSLLEG
jgi:hypothetical protein